MIAITNIGCLISGDLGKGILAKDTILIKNKKIFKIGDSSIVPKEAEVIDVCGMTVMPGLIDSHTHPYLGDWTPRLNMLDWMSNSVHGGVTTMISQGETHMPGKRPRDRQSSVALAILARKSFETFRPGGLKVDGGPIILDSLLKKEDFIQLKNAGVYRVAEIGGGGLYKYKDVKDMLSWAKEFGMMISVHSGGASQRSDSAIMSTKNILRMDPDVAVHINGGPTSLSYKDLQALVEKSDCALEVVYNGNPKMFFEVLKMAKENNCLQRVIFGSDFPTGRGLMIVGILKMITMAVSIGRMSVEESVALASGNTADVFKLQTGKIEKGRYADLVIADAPLGSVAKDCMESFSIGDIPSVAMVISDGVIVVPKGRYTAPPKRLPKLLNG